MATFANTVQGRNELFQAICESMGVKPKWDPANHSSHTTGRPSVGTGGAGSILGGVAHVLCNSKNTTDMSAVFEANPTFQGITRQDMYSCGTSIRILGAKGGHKSTTVAGKMTGEEVVTKNVQAREKLGLNKDVTVAVTTHKEDKKEEANALNAGIKTLAELIRLEAELVKPSKPSPKVRQARKPKEKKQA